MKLKILGLFYFVIVIAQFLTAQQFIENKECSMNQELTFKKGDRWCAIGDSITHAGSYHSYIYLYYATRFPDRRFSLINCGVGGCTAEQTVARFDQDISPHRPTVATVMLGMNDIWWQNKKLIEPGNYILNIQTIIDRLKKINANVILMTPTLYDDMAQNDQPSDSFHNGLPLFSNDIIALSNKYKIPFVDFQKLMKEISIREQKNNPQFSLIYPDRVHPKEAEGILGDGTSIFKISKRSLFCIPLNTGYGRSTIR